VKQSYKLGENIPGTNYTFVRVLGEGGQGVVYEVRDAMLDFHFAMKLLGHDLARDEKGRSAFLNEAKTLVQHRHQNIIRLNSAGITQEAVPRPFFVMDKLPGKSLHEVLKQSSQRRIEVRAAINVAIQVLIGLDSAHTHPTHRLVHRDIKPSNVWLHMPAPNESNAVILDLGIAKVMDHAKINHSDGGFSGTFEYAAPEQYTGGASPKTDLYAVGAMLFQMITGRYVFVNADRMEIARAHIREIAPRMSSIIAVPEELDAIVAQALEKDPKKRPYSAHEFAGTLRAIREVLLLRAQTRVQNASAVTDTMPLAEIFANMQQGDEAIAQSMHAFADTTPAPLPEPGQLAEGKIIGRPIVEKSLPVVTPRDAYPATLESRAGLPEREIPVTQPPPISIAVARAGRSDTVQLDAQGRLRLQSNTVAPSKEEPRRPESRRNAGEQTELRSQTRAKSVWNALPYALIIMLVTGIVGYGSYAWTRARATEAQTVPMDLPMNVGTGIAAPSVSSTGRVPLVASTPISSALPAAAVEPTSVSTALLTDPSVSPSIRPAATVKPSVRVVKPQPKAPLPGYEDLKPVPSSLSQP
jgi:serine/threonine protein kinase